LPAVVWMSVSPVGTSPSGSVALLMLGSLVTGDSG
jgi:hypothetical protein